MLHAGQDLAAVHPALEVSEATYHRRWNQFGGMKSKERRQLTQAWRRDYNQYRPHSVLVYVTPAEFTATCPGGEPR